jgi:segregation and condensation protein A
MSDDRGRTGDTVWDDWEIPPRTPLIPVLHLDGFDGPMDLLLDLAERQRIDLGQISVVALVEQFVATFERLAAHVLPERRAEWLVLAAQLVLLRSRLMFPATAAASEAAEREATGAIARLEALAFLRAAASWLQARPQLGQDVFARSAKGTDPRAASYMALMEACLTVLQGREDLPGASPVYEARTSRLFEVAEILGRMRALVAEMTEPRELAAFLPVVPTVVQDNNQAPREAVAVTLMAALELSRAGEVQLDQSKPLGPIMLSPSPLVAAPGCMVR